VRTSPGGGPKIWVLKKGTRSLPGYDIGKTTRYRKNTMYKLDQEEGRYRVLLLGVGGNRKEEIDSFCYNLSKNYSIPLPLLKKIADRCPIILKKNLSLKKAELLGKTLKSFGANVSVEERRNDPPISLEFQELVPHQIALESSYLRKAPRGTWSVIGRIKNISDEMLSDTWALIQLFDVLGEFITFEEAPLPINPLPPDETSPFKVIFEGDFTLKRISVAFKNASGQPIPAVDKRKKKEWVEVEINDEDEHFFSIPSRSSEVEKRSDIIELAKPTEEMVTESQMKISMENIPPFAEALDISLGEAIREDQAGMEEEIPEKTFLLTLEEDLSERAFEPSTKDLEITQNFSEGNEYYEREGSKSPFELETFQTTPSTTSEELGETAGEETVLGNLEPSPEDKEGTKGSTFNTSVFEEATQLLENISEKAKEVEEEQKIEGEIEGRVEEESFPYFSWIENFKDAVEKFYQRPRDIFSMWFEECRKEGRFINSLHGLLTILVHSRFDQGDPSHQALGNTQRVFRIVVQPNLLLEEIPCLEGTTFEAGEVWKDLFHRALPKIQQIGNAILEKSKWNAFDLERLIQVIPHMGHQNSRLAIRSIQELIPDIVEVDFSNTPVVIEESLYRVASRLGIVDPHFDSFQGRNSIGDVKIQSFANTVFPEKPVKIEEPMSWMGMEEGRGGHCFRIQPRCEGCLFETFCPRFYPHFNPSEKGMRE